MKPQKKAKETHKEQKMTTKKISKNVVLLENIIQNKIYLVRDKKVMLDKDLAQLYGVKPFRLREQVKRNTKRFPPDFMFQLNEKETNEMVSQNAIPSHKVLGGHAVTVFTEHGILMLSSVLNSERAIEVNIQIMRTFVKLREMMQTHKDLKRKIESMEKKYDHQFRIVFDAIKKLLEPPTKTKKSIGFHTDN